MRTYIIFDCTVLASRSDRLIFGPAFVARLFAAWRSYTSGRLHDFAVVGR